LHHVFDPELNRPITDLGMVEKIDVDDENRVTVRLLLTTAGCPLRARLTNDVTEAVLGVDGVADARVEIGVMNEEQREAVRTTMRGGMPERLIPFAQPGNPTRVIAVASGKGGVGKSSIAVNLACALAASGKDVGLIDADIYGHSVPDLLGIDPEDGPTTIEGIDMITPVEARGLKVMSIGMMKPSRDQVVAWRGPILDRVINQFLTDVLWGDLDFLVIDLPPGTGDIQIGLGQKLPNAEVIVVTTPQAAAIEIAERAGTMADMLHQRVIGVIENLSYLDTECPHCHQTHRVDLFGQGGGAEVAASLSQRLGYEVPLLAEVPIEPAARTAGDEGVPFVLASPPTRAGSVIGGVAERLAAKKRNLAGLQLGLQPA
jgi:ATP-binding protein involved in chromosome partitioning